MNGNNLNALNFHLGNLMYCARAIHTHTHTHIVREREREGDKSVKAAKLVRDQFFSVENPGRLLEHKKN